MIKLSKKWDYAIKTIIFLAKNEKDDFIISDISKQLQISESLLRRIVADLKKVGILTTFKWRNGGVKIQKNYREITLYDILDAVWEELSITDCTKWVYCDKRHSCDTNAIYLLLQRGLNSYLRLYTLERVLKKS